MMNNFNYRFGTVLAAETFTQRLETKGYRIERHGKEVEIYFGPYSCPMNRLVVETAAQWFDEGVSVGTFNA